MDAHPRHEHQPGRTRPRHQGRAGRHHDPTRRAARAAAALDLDTAGIDKALGHKGTADGGIYKVTIARNDTIVDNGHVLPPTFGVTTGINFQPVGGGRAAINGDFAMTVPEVQKVLQALRKGNIDVVELHNHSFTEQPRLFYTHFWAVDDGVTLANALRVAVDATNVS